MTRFGIVTYILPTGYQLTFQTKLNKLFLNHQNYQDNANVYLNHG